jgi:hypothetical protein
MSPSNELKCLLKYLQSEKKFNEHLIARTMRPLNKGYIKNKGLIEFNHGYAAALILVNRGYKSYIDDIRKAISI